jgi:hypothetical protein
MITAIQLIGGPHDGQLLTVHKPVPRFVIHFPDECQGTNLSRVNIRSHAYLCRDGYRYDYLGLKTQHELQALGGFGAVVTWQEVKE